MRGRQHRDPMADRRQGPGTPLGFEAGGDQRLVDRRRQLPRQVAFRRPAHHVIDHELQHGGFGHRQRQFDAVTCRVPARSVAQSTGIAARGVGRRGFGEQFAHRIRGLLRQLNGQCQAGRGLREGRNSGIIIHNM